jgi:surface antigen/peptidoglycan hydrolase CwlO-like protein
VIKHRVLTIMPKQKLSKIAIGVCAILVAIATPLQLARTAQADRYDDQIHAIQEQVDQFQTKAGELQQKANTLQAAVDTIVAEKNAIQAQLDLNQAKNDKLTADIATNKKKLADNQAVLGSIMADLYVDGSISPLEMLASSKNVSEYMDKQEYRTAASEKLNTTIESIKTLKAQLESDQKAVEKLLEEQKAQRAALAAKEAEHQDLLNRTKGEEAAYQQQITSAKAQMAEVAAAQRAALFRATNGGRNNGGNVGAISFRNYSGNIGCAGGYPYCGPLDSTIDPWDLYNRECVSYAAWAAYHRFGKAVQGFAGAGNAYQWPSTATRMGAVTDGTPQVGDVAIAPPSDFAPAYGHAMVVEDVLGGGWVRVSQYNFGGTGEYSTMEIAVSGLSFVHFPNR